jgi:hypothetical protein
MADNVNNNNGRSKSASPKMQTDMAEVKPVKDSNGGNKENESPS